MLCLLKSWPRPWFPTSPLKTWNDAHIVAIFDSLSERSKFSLKQRPESGSATFEPVVAALGC
jgi:hypothetical protein